MKVVIMAGGKGTRISSISRDIPKPMIIVGGKPVLEWEIESLKKQGFDDIIITVCHLKDIIIDYFGDGSKYGVKISYYIEDEPLGNAGALFKIKDQLSDVFLLLNGDLVFDVDFNRFVSYHYSKGGLVTLFTHPNSHPYDSGLIISDEEGKVKNWLAKDDKRPIWYKNRVNAGLHVIDKQLLNIKPNSSKIDLDKQLLKPLAGSGKMYVYDSPEYVKDMGTPDRYVAICNDFKKGIVQIKNLRNKQRAIFLDRDGTINEYVGFVTNIDDFVLKNDSEKAIAKINASGYLAIVISNQPVVARGEITFEELDNIHNKMETLLGNNGAYLDGIFYCPHHPHKGYQGEVKELKIDCDCRKPKPGLFFKASEIYNIDLSLSWMIGDEEIDGVAAYNAGCKYIKIDKTGSLLEAVNTILERNK